ncbi:MAG: PaaI family thioesterase [Caulobacteraceae bacterium]|nr:PaaI family thioesterase [Caulobacteraceae bacterium]
MNGLPVEDVGERLNAMLARIPYAQFLGVRAELAGDEMTLIMPYAERLIGNINLPALHGGVVGAFMEMTALAQLSISVGLARQARPIDVTVEYLRSGRPVTTFARAEIKRIGRRVANVHVEAWQEARGKPVAGLHGHFHLKPVEPPAS